MEVPLEIPDGLRFNEKVFDIGYHQQISPGGVGHNQTIERATPMWYAEYQTPPLRSEREDEARAFFDLLDGGMETFLAYDPRRPMPRAFASIPVTDDPWTQVGQTAPRVTAVSIINGTLTLDRLVTGIVITAGDYISYKVGNIWCLHRAAETVTAVANAATVKVRPRPFVTTGFPVNIRYRRAVCQMKIIGGVQWRDSVDGLPSASFKAFQFIDRT
jgi:hypothetical protein